jgi:hypothetical protein
MLYGPDSTARPTYTTRLQRPISPASSVGFNKARPHYTAASRLSGPITCPLSPVIDSPLPRGLSSGRRDNVKKASVKDRRHSIESASNPSTNISSIFHPIHSGWSANMKLNALDTAAERQ